MLAEAEDIREELRHLGVAFAGILQVFRQIAVQQDCLGNAPHKGKRPFRVVPFDPLLQ